jgi:hypothetical protein
MSSYVEAHQLQGEQVLYKATRSPVAAYGPAIVLAGAAMILGVASHTAAIFLRHKELKRKGGTVRGWNRLALWAFLLAAALAACGGGNATSGGPSPTQPSTSVASTDASAATFCSDLQAFVQKLSDLQSSATNVSDLVDGLQQLGSQTVTVLRNDAQALSGSVAIDAQGVIDAIDKMATTYDPTEFLPNLKAMNEPMGSFVSTYC